MRATATRTENWARRVLVVEHENTLATLLVRGLGEAGMDVVVADTAEAALERVASGSVAAIVLDAMLPRMDGISACRGLRAMGISAPIVMLAAPWAFGDRDAALAAGADDAFLRPFCFDELVARLDQLLVACGEPNGRRIPASSWSRCGRMPNPSATS